MLLNQTVHQVALPLVEDLGCELVGVEVIAGHHPGGQTTLRIYVDHPGGIPVDLCTQISQRLSAVLPVELPQFQNYLLEVSSPGLDRLFFSPSQMVPYVGQEIKLKLRSPLEGRRQWKGKLLSVVAEDIVFEVDGQTMTITFDQIERVRLVPDFSNLFRQRHVGQEGHE